MSAELSITVFILVATAMFFIVPFVITFTKNQLANLFIRRASLIIGCYMMVLDSAIIASISDSAILGLEQELFRFMWIFGKLGWILLMGLSFKSLIDIIQSYKLKKSQTRMGEDV